jgi:hypothetical protein
MLLALSCASIDPAYTCHNYPLCDSFSKVMLLSLTSTNLLLVNLEGVAVRHIELDHVR